MSIGEKPETQNDQTAKSLRLLTLIIIGFSIIFIGIIILIVASLMSGSNTGFGVFILIGPIPIIIGAGPEAQWLILIAIILTIISVITYLAMRRQIQKNRD